MSTLPKHLLGLTKAQLESTCVDCGLCCHAQVKVNKGLTVLVPELRCKFLAQKSGGAPGETCCSVYENRHEVAKGWCLPLADAIEKGVFPKACPYVADMDSYVGAQVLPDGEYQRLKPDIAKSIIEKGQPDWLSDTQWASFIWGEDKVQNPAWFSKGFADVPPEDRPQVPDDEDTE